MNEYPAEQDQIEIWFHSIDNVHRLTHIRPRGEEPHDEQYDPVEAIARRKISDLRAKLVELAAGTNQEFRISFSLQKSGSVKETKRDCYWSLRNGFFDADSGGSIPSLEEWLGINA